MSSFIKPLIAVVLLVSSALFANAFADQSPKILELKRPPLRLQQKSAKQSEAKHRPLNRKDISLTNKNFSGTYKGEVTVHYKGELVTTQAELTISTSEKDLQRSDFNFYVIPEKGQYAKNSWESEGRKYERSVTISESTIYVTDITAYSRGGNSQIRTLVFNRDRSALTFLKTEFDDSLSERATGHIIGRFERIKKN